MLFHDGAREAFVVDQTDALESVERLEHVVGLVSGAQEAVFELAAAAVAEG
jgi:hypothetical protein